MENRSVEIAVIDRPHDVVLNIIRNLYTKKKIIINT